MIKTCQHCGAVNGDASDVCCSCDAPFSGLAHASASRRVTTQVEGNLAVDGDWRREVSTRVQDYRARRRGGARGGDMELQSALPFDSESARSPESAVAAATATMVAAAAAAPVRKAAAARAHRTERFEIAIPQLETAAAGRVRWAAPSGASVSPSHTYPVATLPERRRAAAVDVVLLLFSYGGMLALFTVLGGHLGFNKVDLLVAGATLALFYAQYFALFTVFGGSTPGMMLRGLRVVSFDGATPTSRQMVWRSFGYVVSAGACFLGFLWALWDDDQLCWQDRISQTYITPAEERPLR